MRSFGILFVISALGAVVDQHGGDVGIPLKSVLGPIEMVQDFLGWKESDRSMSKIGNLNPRPPLYNELRQPDHCVFPLDIVILQDLTDSFNDNIDEMRNVQLKRMVTGLASSHPDSRFAVVGFQDKPIWKMGDRDDACWLFVDDFTSDFQTIYDSYSRFTCYGGADAPENQFGALSAALYTGQLQWAPANSERSKLIVVVTDAGPHHADDGVTPEDGRILQPWIGTYSDANAENLCLRTGYPSAAEIRNEIVVNKAYAAFLVFDGDWANGWAANEWQTFNRYIGQPDEFVRQDTENSSMFWEHLSQIIAEIEHVECAPEAPTTTAAPTTATTTTTTTAATTELTTTAAATDYTTTTTTAAPTTVTASATTAGATETTTTTTASTTTTTTTAATTTTTTAAPTTVITATTTTTAADLTTTTAAPTTVTTATTATTTTASATTAGATETATTTTAAETTNTSATTVVESAVGPPVSFITHTPPAGPAVPPNPAECHPTVIVDGDEECVPAPENCWCHPEIIIKVAIRPGKMKLLADNEVVANW